MEADEPRCAEEISRLFVEIVDTLGLRGAPPLLRRYGNSVSDIFSILSDFYEAHFSNILTIYVLFNDI